MRDLERHVRTQGGSPDHCFIDIEMVEQRDRIAREGFDRILRHVVGAIGLTVAQRVEGQHVRPARGQRRGEVLLHQRRDEQARHEQHPALAFTELGVGETVTPRRECRRHDPRLAIDGHRPNYAAKAP
jgi:hypothetical protein